MWHHRHHLRTPWVGIALMELKYAQLIHKFGQKINVHKPINKDMISKIPSVPPSTSNMLNYLKGVSITLAE